MGSEGRWPLSRLASHLGLFAVGILLAVVANVAWHFVTEGSVDAVDRAKLATMAVVSSASGLLVRWMRADHPNRV